MQHMLATRAQSCMNYHIGCNATATTAATTARITRNNPRTGVGGTRPLHLHASTLIKSTRITCITYTTSTSKDITHITMHATRCGARSWHVDVCIVLSHRNIPSSTTTTTTSTCITYNTRCTTSSDTCRGTCTFAYDVISLPSLSLPLHQQLVRLRHIMMCTHHYVAHVSGT